MILFEKFNEKGELLNTWTRTFTCVEDLLAFLIEKQEYLLGGKFGRYKLVIRNLGEPYKKDSDD